MFDGPLNHSDGDDRSPMARAAGLASQVITASLSMALPALGGAWLDKRIGTGPAFLIVGLVLGLSSGTWQIVKLAQLSEKPTKIDRNATDDDDKAQGSAGTSDDDKPSSSR